jgi:hypothetical protein
MIDVVIILVVAAILAAAVWYVVKEKKQGKRCVGCPYAGECAKKACGCGTNKE